MCGLISGALVLLLSVSPPMRLQDAERAPATAVGPVFPRWTPPRANQLSLRKAVGVGALTGAAAGAVGGAWWGSTIGERHAVPTAAALMAGVGAASGALTGATTAALPQRYGLWTHVQAAAVGMAISGATFWAFGAWMDDSHVGRAEFGTMGLGHGAITALVVVRFGS